MRIVGDMDESKQKDGSRNSDGNVPNTNWNDSKFHVNWYNTDNRNANLRSREEVSRRKESFMAPFALMSLASYLSVWKSL